MANSSISRTWTFTSSGSAGGSGTYDYSGTSGNVDVDNNAVAFLRQATINEADTEEQENSWTKRCQNFDFTN